MAPKPAAPVPARGGDADDLDDGLDYVPSTAVAGVTADSDDSDVEEEDEGADGPKWDDDDGDPDREDVPRANALVGGVNGGGAPKSQGTKRKEGEGQEDDEEENEEEKRKKRKLKEKARKQAKAINSAREGFANAPAQLSVDELDAWFVQNMRKTFKAASGVELEDLKIPASNLFSTSKFEQERDLRTLPAFIQDQLPPLPKNLRKPGTPSIIILCLSGMRCVDVIRSLKTMEPKPPGEISKLFAKHFKVPEQIEYLKEKKVWVGVGTPGRIGKILAESDALQIRHNTHILLDLTYEDQKKRTLLTINEIRDEFWKTLFADKKVRDKILQSGVKIGVF